MKKYFRVISKLLAAYLSVALTYRADFIQSTINSLLWSAFSFVSAFLVTSQTPTVLGLNRSDMLLLAAAYGIVVGTHHMFFTNGFRQMPEIFNKGELDGYLLRPFDALLSLSLRKVGWNSSIRIIASIFLTAAILNHYQIYPNLWQILGFMITSIFSVMLIFSVNTISSSILIWHPYLSNITELINNIVGSARYPLDINRYTPRMANLIFIPFLFLVNIPVRSLTNRLNTWQASEYIIFCLLIFVFSRWWWQTALKNYTSASG